MALAPITHHQTASSIIVAARQTTLDYSRNKLLKCKSTFFWSQILTPSFRNFSNANSNFCKQQKQRQTHLKFPIYSTLLLFISFVNGQPDYHYANESPNGGVRQFVDSQDFSNDTQQTTHRPQNDGLPDCSQIPNLLCCTSRVLKKCYDGCLKHVQTKCAHKLRQVDHFQAGNHYVDNDVSIQKL